jgi:citrate synthase
MSSPATQYPNYSPGLEGVPAGITAISEIDSDRSSLQYRGYDVHDLAEQGSYERFFAYPRPSSYRRRVDRF